MRIFAGLLLLVLAPATFAHDVSPASSAVAARMRVSAERVLAALSPAMREKMVLPFDDRDRVDWHYTPRSRNGVDEDKLTGMLERAARRMEDIAARLR